VRQQWRTKAAATHSAAVVYGVRAGQPL